MSGWNLTKKEIKRKEQEEDMKVGERVCRVKRVISNAICVCGLVIFVATLSWARGLMHDMKKNHNLIHKHGFQKILVILTNTFFSHSR